MFLFILTGCSSDSGITYFKVESTTTFAGGTFGAYRITKSGDVDLTYNLELGAAVRDVYFVVSNTSPENSITIPAIAAQTARSVAADSYYTGGEITEPVTVAPPGALRGSPEISAANREIMESLDKGAQRSATLPVIIQVSQAFVPGDTNTFNTTYNTASSSWSASVDAKFLQSYSDGTKTLEIWVATDCLDSGGSKTYLIEDDIVSPHSVLDIVAEKFLQAGTDNDIYDWVTGVFGEEWGSEASTLFSNLITADDTITILFYDIDDDDDAFATSSTGSVAGYFTNAHSYVSGPGGLTGSNERVMFFMDAVMLAYDDPGDGTGNWAITDFWPSEIISTLAHEFQHMIHFYQKKVLQNPAQYTETWLDELLSMATEDLIAKNIYDADNNMSILGPRGIIPSDLSAGTPILRNGRLPLYVENNNISLIDFNTNAGEVLKSYAMSYAFGAFLIRNYDGAAILQDIVQNKYYDYRALASALGVDVDTDSDNINSTNKFSEVMRYWGVAELLSNFELDPATEAEFVLNSGVSGIDDTAGNTLGSINMFNYSYSSDSVSTFKFFDLPFAQTSIPRGAHYYIEAGKNLTGDQQWRIKLPRYIHLDVIVK